MEQAPTQQQYLSAHHFSIVSLARSTLCRQSARNRVFLLSSLTLAIFFGLSGCSDKQSDGDKSLVVHPLTEQAETVRLESEQSKTLAIHKSEELHQLKLVQSSERLIDASLAAKHVINTHYVAAPIASDAWYGIKQPERNRFEKQIQNGIMVAGEIPISTFSIDVDTGSYSTLRRMIKEGSLPEKGTIRIEEMLNYFTYDYPLPNKNAAPFSATTELAPSPYNDDMMLLRIGLKGYELTKSELGASNLVFLLDVSGSMASADKLPLLQTALKMLTQQLSAQDKVSIVVYAGAAGVVLDGASGDDIQALTYALEQLRAGAQQTVVKVFCKPIN